MADPHRVVNVTRINNPPSKVDMDLGFSHGGDTVITTYANGDTTVYTQPDPALGFANPGH